jgi:AraC-like DNA-binding protein
MSNSVKGRVNRGAYERPFSGVGVEFFPLGVEPDRSGLVLHESGYLAKLQQWNYPNVFSPFWRLYYNSVPGHCVLFGDRMIELTPEHIMLIPDHCCFHCLGKNTVPALWLTFQFTLSLQPDIPLPVLLPPRETELCLIRDLKALISAAVEWRPTDAICRNSLALLQVVLARPELKWRPPLPESLARVRSFVDKHIAESLSNDSLAREAGMSVAGFLRLFKKHYGCTPARFVTESRIREAAHRLLVTRESIDSIAEQTGFPNRAYFSRVFHKRVGEPPAGFRLRAGAFCPGGCSTVAE